MFTDISCTGESKLLSVITTIFSDLTFMLDIFFSPFILPAWRPTADFDRSDFPDFYTLKVHKIENFFGFDFEICTFS